MNFCEKKGMVNHWNKTHLVTIRYIYKIISPFITTVSPYPEKIFSSYWVSLFRFNYFENIGIKNYYKYYLRYHTTPSLATTLLCHLTFTCSKSTIETLEISSKLTITTPERRQRRRSGAFIVFWPYFTPCANASIVNFWTSKC